MNMKYEMSMHCEYAPVNFMGTLNQKKYGGNKFKSCLHQIATTNAMH